MTSSYRARQIPDPADFLELSKSFRNHEPYSTQVIGSAATAVVAGSTNFDSHKWWVVEREKKVVGIAMHTAPFNIFVSPMSTEVALTLAELIIHEDPDFPGVNAPKDIAQVFVERLIELSPNPIMAEPYQEHLSYLLEELKMPHDIVGSMRLVQEKDFDLMLRWFKAFADEAGVESHDHKATLRRVIDTQRLYLWIHHEQIVSMAGFTKGIPFPGGTLCRVGPVYTPNEFRKRGYASFVTASVCRVLAEAGHSVMLYTDASNPTSNKVYTNIGFGLTGAISVWKISRK